MPTRCLPSLLCLTLPCIRHHLRYLPLSSTFPTRQSSLLLFSSPCTPLDPHSLLSLHPLEQGEPPRTALLLRVPHLPAGWTEERARGLWLEALLQARATCDPRGSTCCHPLDKPEEQTEHAFINVLTRGDLSSIRWVCSPLRHSRPTAPGVQLCTIYYASLNFRDIMLATGKLSPDAIPGTGSPR